MRRRGDGDEGGQRKGNEQLGFHESSVSETGDGAGGTILPPRNDSRVYPAPLVAPASGNTRRAGRVAVTADGRFAALR
jgi:hypothetical protein